LFFILGCESLALCEKTDPRRLWWRQEHRPALASLVAPALASAFVASIPCQGEAEIGQEQSSGDLPRS
jgi:hypothetical protein